MWLDLPQSFPINIYEDNQDFIKLAESEKNQSRAKHVDIQYHPIKYLHETSIVKLNYLPNEEQITDAITKPPLKHSFIIYQNGLHLGNFTDSHLKSDVGTIDSCLSETRTVFFLS